MESVRAEVRQQLSLAAPVVLVNLSMMAMGVVDTAMAGGLSAEALAAIRYGHAWSFCFIIVGMGLVMALDPLVAQAFGANDRRRVATRFQQGLVVALVRAQPQLWPKLRAKLAH